MPRGTQLITMVEMLRHEIGASSSAAAGAANLPALESKLRLSQVELYDDHDWSFLRVWRQVLMQAGERYYDFPDDMDLDRLEEVAFKNNGIHTTISRGIEPRHMDQYNSEAGARADPVERWDIRWTGTAEQLEVWPIPASNFDTLVFTGIRSLRPLIKPSDVSDLDGPAIVLKTAADIVTDKDKSTKLRARAQARLNRAKGRSNSIQDRYYMGQGDEMSTGRLPPRITISGS